LRDWRPLSREGRLRKLADTPDYSIADVLCTLGPRDRFREQELTGFRVCAVLRGSFGYRSSLGEGIAVAGSLLAGNACDCYRCRHFDEAGDRCVQFAFTGEFLERVRTWIGASGLGEQFARAVRFIEANSAARCSLDRLSTEAGLSAYHFLRVFRRTTGQTPHRYVQAVRLRQAAKRLETTQDKIVDIAAAVGFGDLSNFNASFVRAFGRQPSVYRTEASRRRRHEPRPSAR
jgi:AraC-like DNA-binding protein